MDAAADLKNVGFLSGSVHVITPRSANVTAVSLRAQGVPVSRAESTAQAIHGGRTVVVVQTPLGTVKLAIAVLKRHQTNNSGLSEVRYEGYVGDTTFWLSSYFWLPLLLGNPFPFPTWLGWPLLAKDNPQKSASFGLPFLSKRAFPFSSMLGLKLLSDRRSIFSDFLGIPQLPKNEFPLSSLLGWPLLSRSGSRD